VTLTVSTPGPDGFGPLHSSGMFILNPPYTLEPTLREVMPYLVKVLGKDAGATFTIEKGTQVTGSAVARVGANGAVRMPVGNARRASPMSGTGSLRLPGQAPAGTPGAAGSGPRTPGKVSGRPGESEAAGRPRTSSRPTGPGGSARTSARPTAAGTPPARSGRNNGPRRP
ncbi:MAG: 23S rRNA (adenine(2030)-N(6))-methyltransferase RlmJ, partial [Telluria sp.]